MASDKESKADKEFREEQRQAARAQNQSAENAVPEQRPIASQVSSLPESDVQQALREEGYDEPMGKEAYDRASSDAQEKKAAKEGAKESVREGQRVRITDGPYEGSFAAVVGVTYEDATEALKARSGDPAVANYAKVAEVQVRTRGGRHDLVNLTPDQYENVAEVDYGRGKA
jgi:transcription antitermination factor NusG